MRRYQPALLGGLFIGALSSLPLVNFANACCCLWVVVGGVLTAYLQQQNRAEALEAAEAALGGLIAGLIGAVISVSISAMFALSVDVQEQLRGALDQVEISSELRDRITEMVSGPRFVLLGAAITVPVYAVFSMLGALLGLAIFRKKTPPPPAPSFSPGPTDPGSPS